MKALTLRIPLELYRFIKERSRKQGITMNGLLIGILWKELREKSNNETETQT